MRGSKSPQLENGYIRIATEIWRELARFRISGEERMILDTILAKTYGFNKKQDRISYSQFAEYTELNRPACARAVKKLLSKKIIIVPKKGIYQFNKHYDLWLKLSKKITAPKVLSKKIISVIKKDNKVLSKKINTIDSKDNIQKTYTEKIISTFNEVMKTKYRSVDEKAVEYWLKEFTLDEILAAIKNIPLMGKSEFWASMTLIKFFRTRNTNGKADYIEQALNYKLNNKPVMKRLDTFEI